jgi:4a-hydroxytetrahydrobiopterin dehydratase
MPELLTSEEVQKNLTQLPGWAQSGNAIIRTYSFKAYLDGVGFVNRVASAAEAADHHPDIALGYKQVVVTLTTHSANGITKKDFDLATDIEALV